jgi:hypothetical protein
VLKRDSEDLNRVHHPKVFGSIGFAHIHWASFSERFNIIGMDEKTVTVQCKDETVD